jgi:hypothetical protein
MDFVGGVEELRDGHVDVLLRMHQTQVWDEFVRRTLLPQVEVVLR